MDSKHEASRPLLGGHNSEDEDTDNGSLNNFIDSRSGSPTGKYSSFNGTCPDVCYSPPPNNVTPPPDLSTLSDPDIQGQVRTEEFNVYKRRWYILLLFSLAAMMQSAVWSTFGPIASTSEHAFGWSDGTIALLNNWGPITYLIFGVVASWMLDVKGLRLATIISTSLSALGTVLRCITMEPPAVTWLMHLGQILSGIAGPVFMAGPVVVSAVWFPPSQRTTATAIGALAGSAGSAVCFIMGPLLVPDVPKNTGNGSDVQLGQLSPTSLYDVYPWSLMKENLSTLTARQLVDLQTADTARIHDERKAILLYMYIEAGISIALLLMMLVYFPNKPPLPPCPSAAIQRENFLSGVKQLFTRRQFWLVCFAYGVSLGVFYSWDSILAVILDPQNIGEKEAGWIGFCGSCGSIVSSLIVPRVADYLKRLMKKMVIVFFVVGFISVLVFSLACIGVIPQSRVLFIASNIITHMALAGSVPLLFELACENAYPTGEGTANGVMTIINNFASLVFLAIMMIPNIGSLWMNWMLLGSIGICFPALIIMKERYRRLEIDEHNPSLTAEIYIPTPSSGYHDSATQPLLS